MPLDGTSLGDPSWGCVIKAKWKFFCGRNTRNETDVRTAAHLHRTLKSLPSVPDVSNDPASRSRLSTYRVQAECRKHIKKAFTSPDKKYKQHINILPTLKPQTGRHSQGEKGGKRQKKLRKSSRRKSTHDKPSRIRITTHSRRSGQ